MKHLRFLAGAIAMAAVLAPSGCSSGSSDPGGKPGGSAASITTFKFEAIDNPDLAGDVTCAISGTSITGNAGFFTPLKSLVPTIFVSSGASVLPDSGSPEDFRGPVVYTVTSDDGTLSYYTVTLSNGTVSVVAGQEYVTGHADGTGTGATFFAPDSLCSDGTDLYIADTQNSTIRKIALPSGAVTTIAGSAGTTGYSAVTQTGAIALFNRPSGIACYGNALYVADTLNNNVRKIDLSSGTHDVSTFGVQANYHGPKGIATDGTSLFFSDTDYNRILMETIGDAQITSIAGLTNHYGSYIDDTGTNAAFNVPIGIATDGANLYIADYNNNAIRKLVIATKAVTTLAGQTTASGSADGVGAAATFNHPTGITLMGPSLYIADYGNSRLRKLDLATNEVSTLVPSSGGLMQPYGITNAGGCLYVSEWSSRIVKVQ
jgi:hypothetical protein